MAATRSKAWIGREIPSLITDLSLPPPRKQTRATAMVSSALPRAKRLLSSHLSHGMNLLEQGRGWPSAEKISISFWGKRGESWTTGWEEPSVERADFIKEKKLMRNRLWSGVTARRARHVYALCPPAQIFFSILPAVYPPCKVEMKTTLSWSWSR